MIEIKTCLAIVRGWHVVDGILIGDERKSARWWGRRALGGWEVGCV